MNEDIIVTKAQIISLIKAEGIKPHELFSDEVLSESNVEREIRRKIDSAKAEAVEKLKQDELAADQAEAKPEALPAEPELSPFLDPAKNPMIPGSTAPPLRLKKDADKAETNKYLRPETNPFIKLDSD